MPAPVQLLVIVAAMLVFWAVVMRPARNQQKRVAQLQDSLEVGQEVVLSSGIFGTVRALTEGRVELEVAPGTVLTVARQVVVRQVSELELSTAAEQETPTDTHNDTHTDTHTGTGTGSDPGRATSDGPGESGPTKAED
jgi:preprotein translocase subunit YajC